VGARAHGLLVVVFVVVFVTATGGLGRGGLDAPSDAVSVPEDVVVAVPGRCGAAGTHQRLGGGVAAAAAEAVEGGLLAEVADGVGGHAGRDAECGAHLGSGAAEREAALLIEDRAPAEVRREGGAGDLQDAEPVADVVGHFGGCDCLALLRVRRHRRPLE